MTVGLAVLGLGMVSCGSDEPTNVSPTITAPALQSPASGSTVTTGEPTLTVGNATGATGLSYRFEVASDSGFGTLAAVGDGIAEGSGSTSWQTTPALEPGETFFWRARASANGTSGPYSATASFGVEGGFFSKTPVNRVLVFDPLTTGTSVGEVGGGEFRSGGWMTTDATSYIRYDVPTLENGFVEFQVTNLRNPNTTPVPLKRNLLIMWDPTRGDYTENPFRVHIAKFDTRLVDRWHMRLRWISQGQERNTGFDFFDWDPNQIYTFRMEWGAFPEIVSTQRVRVLMDGREVMVRNYDPIYNPSTHWIELGMAPREETLEQAIYSNVVIGIREP